MQRLHVSSSSSNSDLLMGAKSLSLQRVEMLIFWIEFCAVSSSSWITRKQIRQDMVDEKSVKKKLNEDKFLDFVFPDKQ